MISHNLVANLNAVLMLHAPRPLESFRKLFIENMLFFSSLDDRKYILRKFRAQLLEPDWDESMLDIEHGWIARAEV